LAGSGVGVPIRCARTVAAADSVAATKIDSGVGVEVIST